METRGPNILITGTPGTGKSTLACDVSERCDLLHLNISELAKAKHLTDGYDDELQCEILDEEKVVDELDGEMRQGGCVVDYHGCDFFPQRWFNIVFVLRADNKVLYDRLSKRGYTENKLRQNLECEIFQTLLDEAKSSYDEEIVHELRSDNVDEMGENADRIAAWIEQWKTDHRLCETRGII